MSNLKLIASGTFKDNLGCQGCYFEHKAKEDITKCIWINIEPDYREVEEVLACAYVPHVDDPNDHANYIWKEIK